MYFLGKHAWSYLISTCSIRGEDCKIWFMFEKIVMLILEGKESSYFWSWQLKNITLEINKYTLFRRKTATNFNLQLFKRKQIKGKQSPIQSLSWAWKIPKVDSIYHWIVTNLNFSRIIFDFSIEFRLAF